MRSLIICLLTLGILLSMGCNKDDDSSIDIYTEDGLIAFYPFDGNALDHTEYSNHGEVSGPTLTSDRNQNENSAYYFNGIDDVILVKDSKELYLNQNFTLNAWVKTDMVKTQHIIRKGAAVNGPHQWPYGLAMSGTGDIIFCITSTDGVQHQARKSGYEVNVWYMITGVLDDGMMHLYENGALVKTVEMNGDIVDDPNPLLIGTRLRLPSSTFSGIIDEVRIYDRSLSSEEIFELYNE